nr:MAG TPA: Integrase [Caudoviricetes sp.]
MWKKVQAMAGVPYRSFHCLHHTHATLLLANGIPIIEVSRRLGHANVTQTLDTYGHSIPNYDQGIADEIEKIYNT